MTRALLILFLALLIAHPASAQVCNPRCESGNHCIFVGNNNDTSCIQDASADGTVAAIEVTAAHRTTFADLVYKGIVPFVDQFIIPTLYILAFLFFLIGVARFFFTGGEENREKGKAFVIWALVGMVAIFAVWGIVRLLLTVIPGT